MKLTEKRVRKLRARIQANRCPEKPGITHWWTSDEFPDWTSWGTITMFVCCKCGVIDRSR